MFFMNVPQGTPNRQNVVRVEKIFKKLFLIKILNGIWSMARFFPSADTDFFIASGDNIPPISSPAPGGRY